jgi:hypothetical protein
MMWSSFRSPAPSTEAHDTDRDAIGSSTLPMVELAAKFRSSAARAILCIVDCCFNRPPLHVCWKVRRKRERVLTTRRSTERADSCDRLNCRSPDGLHRTHRRHHGGWRDVSSVFLSSESGDQRMRKIGAGEMQVRTHATARGRC